MKDLPGEPTTHLLAGKMKTTATATCSQSIHQYRLGTSLLSPPKTPAISRTLLTPDSLLDLVDDVRRQRSVNNKTPHAVIGGGQNPLSPDYSPQTPNTLRNSKEPAGTPTIRSPLRMRTSGSPATASLSLASDFEAATMTY